MTIFTILLGLFLIYVPFVKIKERMNKGEVDKALDLSDPHSLATTIQWFLGELEDSKNQELLAYVDHSTHHEFYLELEFFDKTISANIDHHGAVEIIKFNDQDDFPAKSYRAHFKPGQIKYILPQFTSLKIKTDEIWAHARPLAKVNTVTSGAELANEAAATETEEAGE